MIRLQYWLGGGEERALPFQALVQGTKQTIGPFADRASALAASRSVPERDRHRCLVRVVVDTEVRRATDA